ncbi:hypothetical protein CEXT_408361 [Caerostris extrusa]|uniref:Uncharacterized protein n=1 Tax=Caerostris extrusa TaxID=172846 RepID=A0AAV4SAJ5_CAEEX|nr:hypothetical protein CEXT_408361 [Caerostris extrusa]
MNAKITSNYYRLPDGQEVPNFLIRLSQQLIDGLLLMSLPRIRSSPSNTSKDFKKTVIASSFNFLKNLGFPIHLAFKWWIRYAERNEHQF